MVHPPLHTSPRRNGAFIFIENVIYTGNTMKNLTYHGVSSFLPAIYEAVKNGTYADFWKEINGKMFTNISTDYSVGANTIRFTVLHELIDYVVANAKDLTEDDIRSIVGTLLRVTFIFDRKYVFMMSVIEKDLTDVVEVATIEAEQEVVVVETVEAPVQEVNPVVKKTGVKAKKS
jgi:nitrogen regulatory protein PII-like uncharacterized protein